MELHLNVRFKKSIPLLVSCLLVIQPLIAQREYDRYGKGARAAGMAYAFNAVSDDATALSWNPAGIVQIKKPELAFVNLLTATKLVSRLDNFDYHPVYNIDYLGFVYPLKLKMKDLVFGISFQNKINLKFNYTSIPSELDKYEGRSRLTVNTVSICGAYSINRYIAAGLSYNRWFSLGNSIYEYDEYNTYIDTTKTYEFEKKNSYSGNNFTAGIFLDFSSLHFPLRFAIEYEDRCILKRDRDETYKLNTLFTSAEDENWTYTHDGYDKEYIPRIITTGLAYRLGNYLTLACDLEMRLLNGKFYEWDYRWVEKFTTGNYTELRKDTLYTGEVDWDKFYARVNQYRFGAEYIIHVRNALIPVRAGWKSNPTSLYDYSSEYTTPHKVYANSINAGTGYVAERFSIDFAFERYKYERTTDLGHHEKKTFSNFLLSAILYLK